MPASLKKNRQNLEEEANRLNKEIRDLKRVLSFQESKIKEQRSQIYSLAGWMEQLNGDFNDLLNSWRWRVGNVLIRVVEAMLLRKRVPLAVDHIRKRIGLFEEDKASLYKDFEESLPKKESGFHSAVKGVYAQIENKYFGLRLAESEMGIGIETKIKHTPDSEPLVSVIMPTYNRAPILLEAIQSVQEQAYQNWELLVCDDGSRDDTFNVVSQLRDPRIKYLKLKHAGAAAARNRGLERAMGSLIAYLDTDNIWHPEYLKIMVREFSANLGQYCAYAQYIDAEYGEDGPKLRSFKPLPFSYEKLREKNFIDLNGFVHRIECYECLGGFTEELARQQDWDLILKYTYLRNPISVDKLLVFYRRNKNWNQLTSTEAKQSKATKSIVANNMANYLSNGLPNVRREKEKRKITILSWDISRNHFSKAYNLAECLCKDFHVQLVGFRFFEEEIFPPYRNESPPFKMLYLKGSSFSDFRHAFAKALVSIEGDVVYCVKPRLPSLGLGLLANYHFGKSLILEINDLESVVSSPEEGDSIEHVDLANIDLSNKELLNPYSDIWSRILETFAQDVPMKVTHNKNLNEYFGGDCFFVRNLKDEEIYNPERYDRAGIRRELGFSPKERVILFGGMVRKHKGIFELLEFINHSKEANYRLLIVGSRNTPDQRNLKKKANNRVTILPPQGRNDMAKINYASDAVILWLDPKVAASHYQMPYKLTDALAMEVPVIANDISDLGELGRQGFLRLVPYGDYEGLAVELKSIFENREATDKMVEAGRRLFLRQFSYNSALRNIQIMLEIEARHKESSRASEDFARFFSAFYRQMLRKD